MPGRRWTREERKQLRRQIKTEGRALEEVEIEDRSIFSIRSQAARMGLVAQRAPRFHWPLEQRELLKQLKADGFTPKQIHEFELLGKPTRSRWAITKQWGRMKLADRNRSRQMRKRKIWKAGERDKFDAFLKKNSKQMTPEEIARQWGVARSTVARRQTELGVKASRDEVMQMDYSLAKQRRARARLRRENLKAWAERRENREAELIELAEQLQEQSPGIPQQTCSDCERTWPKRREFFHTRDKRISIGTSRYYKHRCVLCENARRRNAERRRKQRSARSQSKKADTQVTKNGKPKGNQRAAGSRSSHRATGKQGISQ